MNDIRKKQKRLFTIMKILIAFTAVFIFVFIGAEPYVLKASQIADTVLRYFSDIIVVLTLVSIFIYYSKYGKCDAFLTSVENEINDAGYYLTSREETDIDAFTDAIFDDLSANGFSVSKNIELSDLGFSLRAYKKSKYFYAVNADSLDRNDVLAYLDEVINDITVKNLKRKGNGVLCLLTDKAQDDAIELSKMITPIGRKGQLKIALAIVEPSTKKVFFLGNCDTPCKAMIANYVMNCDIPIKEKYIHTDKLEYQNKLKEKMKDFTIEKFKKGTFYIH